MYICKECGLIFNQPAKYEEDRTPGGAFEGGSFIESFSGCPRCSGGYDEAMLCPRCEDTYISTNSRDPFCDDCVSNLLTQARNIFDENFREDEIEIIINHIDEI